MEAAEIDEGVGAEEEIGNDGSDGVEFSFKDPGKDGQHVGLCHRSCLAHTDGVAPSTARPERSVNSTFSSGKRVLCPVKFQGGSRQDGSAANNASHQACSPEPLPMCWKDGTPQYTHINVCMSSLGSLWGAQRKTSSSFGDRHFCT